MKRLEAGPWRLRHKRLDTRVLSSQTFGRLHARLFSKPNVFHNPDSNSSSKRNAQKQSHIGCVAVEVRCNSDQNRESLASNSDTAATLTAGHPDCVQVVIYALQPATLRSSWCPERVRSKCHQLSSTKSSEKHVNVVAGACKSDRASTM